jgi:hypothetical protein
VNEFVEDCRREWKRLGVPDPVADEMAVELAADLGEAEAEGVSAEEVLGTGALDPRSFAAGWAAERGVIQRPSPSEGRRFGRFRMIAAIGTFALVAIVGAVLLIVVSPSASRKLALASPVAVPPPGVALMRLDPPPWTTNEPLTVVRSPVEAPPPVAFSPDGRQIVVGGLPARGVRTVAIDIDDSGADTRMIGAVLLTLGLTGFALLTAFSVWAGRRTASVV